MWSTNNLTPEKLLVLKKRAEAIAIIVAFKAKTEGSVLMDPEVEALVPTFVEAGSKEAGKLLKTVPLSSPPSCAPAL
jgi:hypothetical protein